MYNDNGTKTFEADAAIAQYARVILEADGKIVTAGIAQIGDGIAMREAFAAGDSIPVKLWNSAGTFKMIAGEAFAAGADLYTEVSGKVQDTAASTSFKFAKAFQAASSDGSIIECALLQAPGVSAES
ncbi:capsid cement protein [Rhodopirellula halodulae]|uniref:capsid cement protein n=1 Tax=Rhodopirellula halodulae TaxID=2894198 RepID=UPI001E500075|nr:capsid cement protein [Rhodopirellula sp. JC737]MCC9655290.1 DUF2190 family protein [Rhodopirellula sp. JC737]